jgi:hypothetical protein
MTHLNRLRKMQTVFRRCHQQKYPWPGPRPATICKPVTPPLRRQPL